MKLIHYIYFCVFAIPFLPQGVGFFLGSGLPTIDLPRLLTASLIIFWLMKKAIRGEPLKLAWNGITKALLLLIGIQFLTISVSNNHLMSFSQWFGYVFYYYIIYFILLDQINTAKEWQNILRTVIFLTICLGCISLFEFIFQIGIYDNIRTAWSANPMAHFNPNLWRIEELGRSSKGPFGNSYPFGFLFTITFFLVMYTLFTKNKFTATIYRVGGLLITFAGLLATQVRAAIFSIGIVFFASLIHNKRFTNYSKYIVCSILIISILFVIVINILPYEALQDTFYSSLIDVSPNQSSLYKRIDGLIITTKDIIKKPILGYGTGAVVKHMTGISNFQLKSDLPLVIALWIESGIIAAFAYIYLIYYTLKGLYKYYRDKKNNLQVRILSYFLILSILSFAIATISAPHLESSFVFFTILALASAIISKKNIKVNLI